MRVGTLRQAFTGPADQGTWVTEHVLACRYPRTTSDLATLAGAGVTVLVNLHTRRHDLAALAPYGITEIHLPVRDFLAPTPGQLDAGVAVIVRAATANTRVAVHCRAGLGRTGTLVSCYLVHQGRTADEAIALLRTLRPGSVETARQARAVFAYALHHPCPHLPSRSA